MYSEVRKYYEVNFGSFDSMTATEIELLNNIECRLVGVDGILFLKTGWTTNNPAAIVPKHVLHSLLNNSLGLIVN